MIDDVQFEVDPQSSDRFASGTYYYAVSAVFAGNDASNPSGESLPSEPASIIMPALDLGLKVTLAWTSVPGAVSYRVYRTRTPDANVFDMALLRTVTTPGITDDGQAAPPSSADQPLRPGALTNWQRVGALRTARWGAATSVLALANDAVQVWLAGGETARTEGTPTAKVETVRVASGTPATIGAQTDATNLPAARSFGSLMQVSLESGFTNVISSVNPFCIILKLFVINSMVLVK